jgi:hypothetical protein
VTTPARKTPFDRDHKPDDRTVHGRAQPSERDRHDGRSPLITQTKISKTTPGHARDHGALESNENFEDDIFEPDNPSKSSRGSESPLISNDALAAVPPELLDLLETVQDVVRDLQARVAALEGREGPSTRAGEDGSARLPGIWCTAKEAAYRLGYSASGLRNLAKQRRIVFDTEGNGRRIYNIASVVAPSAPSAS